MQEDKQLNKSTNVGKGECCNTKSRADHREEEGASRSILYSSDTSYTLRIFSAYYKLMAQDLPSRICPGNKSRLPVNRLHEAELRIRWCTHTAAGKYHEENALV